MPFVCEVVKVLLLISREEGPARAEFQNDQ